MNSREVKGPEKDRKFPNPRNASQNQMLPRRRILLPATIRRATIRRESAVIAARVTIEARAVATADKGTIAGADAAGAGDDVAVEAEAAATGAIKEAATCLRRSTHRRRANEITGGTIIVGRRAIAGRRHQDRPHPSKTRSCFRVNRWRSTGDAHNRLRLSQ